MKYPDLFNPDLSRMGTAESQMYNLVAGELVTRVVGTSLGPRGMSKVYIDILGEETITGHGGAFLRKVDVDHPAAKAVVDAVNSVDNHVGDGTTTAAVLVGALLRHAKELRALRVPTACIISGYEEGLEIALRDLARMRAPCSNSSSSSGTCDGRVLRRLIECCMVGSSIVSLTHDYKNYYYNNNGNRLPQGPGGIIDMIVDAAYRTSDFSAGRSYTDDVKIEEKQGNASQTELVAGTIIDKPIDDDQMIHDTNDARILLVNESLERSRTKTDSEITITQPRQMGEFVAQESENVMRVVRGVMACGANVVISRKGIDSEAQEALSKRGIISVRRVKHNDIWWLEKSTGAITCTDIEDIASAELGHAGRVYERSVGGDKMVFVESGNMNHGHTGSVTLLLRASSKPYLDEFHRDALNALYVARDYVESPYVVYGGGSCEAVLAHGIRARMYDVSGKTQVALGRFADALESIPLTLAENAGMQVLDALPKLRAAVCAACGCIGSGDYSGDHNPGGSADNTDNYTAGAATCNHVNQDVRCRPLIPSVWHGIDHHTRKILDMSTSGCNVIDSYAVKIQVLKSATEVACTILNVDDVFVKDLIDNTHCHIDGTVHAHHDPGRNHNHWEQEGLEQRQIHHYY